MNNFNLNDIVNKVKGEIITNFNNFELFIDLEIKNYFIPENDKGILFLYNVLGDLGFKSKLNILFKIFNYEFVERNYWSGKEELKKESFRNKKKLKKLMNEITKDIVSIRNCVAHWYDEIKTSEYNYELDDFKDLEEPEFLIKKRINPTDYSKHSLLINEENLKIYLENISKHKKEILQLFEEIKSK